MNLSQRQAAMAAIHAGVPAIDCFGLCHPSCGPIRMTRVEHDTIRQRHGVDIPQTGTDMCPALTVLGRCSVYADRPLLCRIWGVVESLPCQWGCRPARVLTDAEGYGLLARAADVDGDRAAAARFRQGAA